MKPVISAIRWLSPFPVVLACLALFALMTMTFFDVVLRSVFNSPIEAATELTRILMAIVVFSVLPQVSAQAGHIAVDLMDSLFFRWRLHNIRDGLGYVLCGALMYWPAQRIWILAERWRDYGDVTEYLAIPQFYIGWFIALSVALSGIVMVGTGLLTLFAPRLLERA
ncbi:MULTISPECIES: TRAP transporter small permease [Rhodobacterales]|uniref:TRAP transporter small permease protein n=1 Tax=Halocynthiibacter styelae TaxID=2761955 RepID=A0A8J7LUP3_9RHOB|nr:MULTISPECIES: TRAP transporter small permease subunit [Rhodobacterales]MBI1492832.1 TRAP transporter small permease subunit [Paenihalocynthiibacter styelae]